MEWISIALLIATGLALVLLEILFIPGTTFVGLLGLAAIGGAVYLGYRFYGESTGTILLVGNLVGLGALTFWAFRSRAWERFSLKSQITSTVDKNKQTHLTVGDQGTSLSVLRPFGTADFKGQSFEVCTQGEYVEAHSPIRIIKIENRKIYVAPVL